VSFDGIFFNPDNRLLGGALGDLSLYGGQDTASFSIQGAAEPGGALSDGGAAGFAPVVGPVAVAASGEVPLSFAVDGDAGMVEAAAVPAASYMLASSLPAFQPVEFERSEFSGSVLAPTIVSTQFAAPVAPTVPVHDAAPTALAEAAHGAPDLAAPLSTTVSDISTPLGETLTDLTGTTLHAVTDLVADVADSALTAVSDITASLGSTLGELAGATGPLLDGVGNTVEAVVGGIGDTLSDLAGSDPLGGVATLVSLVSVPDLLGLHDVAAPTADATPDLGLGIVDSLIGASPVEALLGTGDHHHEEGGIGHLLDLDHPLGF
jgi:hypothetical protein